MCCSNTPHLIVYCCESHGRALLGRDTAEKLNVLRVGLAHPKYTLSQVKGHPWTLLELY